MATTQTVNLPTPPASTPRPTRASVAAARPADISSVLLVRHLRAAPTAHVLFYRGGRLAENGRGLAFWFLPLGATICVVPLDDREQSVIFRGRSADFQEITVNGVIVYRVEQPDVLAGRVDFAIDARTGAYENEPLDRLAAVITQLSQQIALTWMGRRPLADALGQGPDALRAVLEEGLRADAGLAGMGLTVVAARIASIAPTSEMEKALQMPTRESIQQQADQATFARRALAVEKERAIQENELSNQIELARREETLIAQRGQNERRRAQESAESKRIEAEGVAENIKINALAQSESIRALETAKVEAERERMDIYRDLPPAALMGLAARELAGKLQSIEHLNLSPDMLGSLLERVLGAGARRLEADNRGA